jgi:hypothetical protein
LTIGRSPVTTPARESYIRPAAVLTQIPVDELQALPLDYGEPTGSH